MLKNETNTDTNGGVAACGLFSGNGEEFWLEHPNKQPRAWNNYLWNDSFLAQTLADGTGASFLRHPKGERTTLNGGRRRVFVQDKSTGAFTSFPTGVDGERVVFGQGYTTYEAEWQGLKLSLQIRVPDGVRGELWLVRVENTGASEAHLNVYSFMDVSLSGYHTPFHITCLRSDFDAAKRVILYTNTDAHCTLPYFNGFVACDSEVAGYDAAYAAFIGCKPGIEKPDALLKGACTNTPYLGYGPAGVIQTPCDLAPGGESTVRFLYGVHDSVEEVDAAIKAAFAGPAVFQSGPAACEQEQNARFKSVSPDAELDRLFNTWAKHNLRFCLDWTRIYSTGFRDTLQDAMGASSLNPAATREKILKAMAHVYRSGRCVRAWNAVNTLADELYADGPIWIPLAINSYIKETGDTALLDEVCPFLDEGSGTVLEHMLAAARFLYEDRGAHGLCRIHDGDWCDTAHMLGKKGHGVGVWLTIALYHALGEIMDLARFVKNATLVDEMREKRESLRAAVNEAGWDGAWYRIAFNDDGRAIGSAAERTGKIFLNPQSWAVISGIADSGRAQQCLQAIDTELDSPVGPLLLSPAFDTMDRTIGTITGFSPGTIENGSCYCHAAAFKVVADCMSGRGGKAYATLRAIMPGGDADQSNPGADCPPFAFTNSRAAMFHPYIAGKSLGLWVTGTVAWTWVAYSEWILGVRKNFEGLMIDPCIPAHWDGFSVQRIFRGCTYDIEVTNPDHVEHGVSSILVDGQKWTGSTLPIQPGKTIKVHVVMGAKKFDQAR